MSDISHEELLGGSGWEIGSFNTATAPSGAKVFCAYRTHEEYPDGFIYLYVVDVDGNTRLHHGISPETARLICSLLRNTLDWKEYRNEWG